MPREPIPRRAKEEKKEPTDYASLIRPVFTSSAVVGLRKREEEAAKAEAAKAEAAATPKKKLTQKQRTSKPTYAKMIASALVDLQERPGSSGPAIAKYIEANFGKYLPDNFKIFLRRALKKAVDENILRHEGARYRLSSSGKYKLGLKKRKKAPKKKSSSSSSSSKRKSSSRSKSPKRSKSPSRSSSKKSKSSSKKDDKKSKKKSSTSSSKAKEAKVSSSSSSRSTRSSSSSSSSSSEKTSSSSKKATPKTTPAGYDHFWEYQEGARWLPYDAAASDVVEKAYLDYKKNPGMCDVRAVKSGQWQYQVDFLNNKQTNIQHENHTVRSIRRIAL